jgi:hypothetical protein
MSTPSISFQTSGAVPMAAEESPTIFNSRGTIAASGKGQLKTVFTPMRSLASPLSKKKDTLPNNLLERAL